MKIQFLTLKTCFGAQDRCCYHGTGLNLPINLNYVVDVVVSLCYVYGLV